MKTSVIGTELKIFQSGNSLALRIPKVLNLSKEQKAIIKNIDEETGDVTINFSKAKNEWQSLFDVLAKFDANEIERPKPLPTTRDFSCFE